MVYRVRLQNSQYFTASQIPHVDIQRSVALCGRGGSHRQSWIIVIVDAQMDRVDCRSYQLNISAVVQFLQRGIQTVEESVSQKYI